MNQTNNTPTCVYKYMLRDTVIGDTMLQARSGKNDIRQWALCNGIKEKEDHIAMISLSSFFFNILKNSNADPLIKFTSRF